MCEVSSSDLSHCDLSDLSDLSHSEVRVGELGDVFSYRELGVWLQYEIMRLPKAEGIQLEHVNFLRHRAGFWDFRSEPYKEDC